MDKATNFEFFLTNFLIMSHEFTNTLFKKYTFLNISFLIFNKERIFIKSNNKIKDKCFVIENTDNNFKEFYEYFLKNYNLNNPDILTNISNNQKLLSFIFTINDTEKFINKYSFYVYFIKISKNISLFYILGFEKSINTDTNILITSKLKLIGDILKSLNANVINNLPIIKIIKTLRFTSFFIANNKNEIITFYTPDILLKQIKNGQKLDEIFQIIVLKKIIKKKLIIKKGILYYNHHLYNDITLYEIILDSENKLSPRLIILKNNFFVKKEQLISEIFSILYNKEKSYNKKFNEIVNKIRIFYNADYIFLSYPFLTQNNKNYNPMKHFTNIWEDFKTIEIKNQIEKGKRELNKYSFSRINNLTLKSREPVFVDITHPLFQKDPGFKFLNIKSQITYKLIPKNDNMWLLGLCYLERNVILDSYYKSLFKQLGLIIAHFLESMRYNESIKETVKNYKTLFESIPLPILLINKNLQILQTNKFFIKMVNSEPNTILSTKLTDLFKLSFIKGNIYYFDLNKADEYLTNNPLNYSDFINFIKNYNIKNGKFLLKLDNKDDYYIFEIHKREIINNKNIQYILIFYDLTEKIKMTKKFAEIDKFQSLGNIASTVAHEFNNLLTGIKGNIELINFQLQTFIKDYKNADTIMAELKESIKDINYLTEKGKKLTINLLGYSKKRPSKLEIIELNQFLTNEIKVLKNLIGEKVDIELKTYKNPIFIEIDKNGLSHVLMNLCINAKDAMNDNGTISIILDKLKITKKEYPDIDYQFLNKTMAILKVKDTGYGIRQKHINKIFEPFFTTKGEAKGTGLGLSFVKGFVQQHNGFISVESTPSKGTTFKIHLYISKKKSTDSEKNSISSDYVKNKDQYLKIIKSKVKNILLIEDEETILKYLKKSFNNIGINTFEADNFQEAKNQISIFFNKIDFIISDVILKQDSGYNLYHSMKNLKNIPWIFISGYPLNITKETNYIKENIALLQKPFEFYELIELMCKILIK